MQPIMPLVQVWTPRPEGWKLSPRTLMIYDTPTLTGVVFDAYLTTQVRGHYHGHGLMTGDSITISGTTNWNGVVTVTKLDNDNFTLDGKVWATGADNTGDVATGRVNGEYILRISNHMHYPLTNADWSGRIKFSMNDAYWQGDKIQAKEVYNADPNACGMNSTVDGSYANLHGFTVESIPPGGWRIVRIKLVGDELTFEDTVAAFSLLYPSPV
jgi:hypothetical protein